MNNDTVIEAYKPLTSSTRVEDFNIPDTLVFNNKEITLPESIKRKNIHYLVNSLGEAVRATWISEPLAHILNALRLEDPETKTGELDKAIKAIDNQISSLIKDKILRDKKGPGAMAFCQSNENVPEDSILISERSYNTLCLQNPRWEKAKTVMVVRFPNLGPNTTQELKLVVNKPMGLDLMFLPEGTIGTRLSNFSELLKTVEQETYEDIVDTSGIIDAFYLHPNTLKDKFQGDGDGDIIFAVIEKLGTPNFKGTDLTREPDSIKEEDVDMLFSKANRLDRTNLKTWLPNYFDDVPIGPATYAIRWMLYKKLAKFKGTEHPMGEAWKEISPKAIQMIEFVMDIRKGDWTDKEIDTKLNEIKSIMQEIRTAKEKGDWFAKTVPTSTIDDLPNFIRKFDSLQTYVNYITKQTP